MEETPTFRAFYRCVYRRWSETVTGSRSASYIILAAVIGVVDVVFAATLQQSIGIKILIGTAPPLLFFFVAFIYAVFSVWRAERKTVITLETRLTPVLKLNFDQHSDGIVYVPTKVVEQDEQGRPVLDASGMPIVIDSNGAYVRIRLTAVTDAIVKKCSAYLTKIEKRNASGIFETIRMPQAHRLTGAFVDVPPRVPQTIDFLQAGERDNKLLISGGISFALLNALREITTYKFTVNVIPQEGPDQVIVVEINWSGQWNTISGQEI